MEKAVSYIFRRLDKIEQAFDDVEKGFRATYRIFKRQKSINVICALGFLSTAIGLFAVQMENKGIRQELNDLKERIEEN